MRSARSKKVVQTTCTEAIKVAQSGRLYITFDEKDQLEFQSERDLIAYASDFDESSPTIKYLLSRLILQWWLKQNPDASNLALLADQQISLNLSVTPTLTVLPVVAVPELSIK